MSATHRGLVALGSAALLAFLFTAFQIQSSLSSGALSLPVTYDDVGYFNDALMRFDLLVREGGRSFFSSFITQPPHAPLSTFLAILGFGLFGPNPWAADAMNSLPLAAFVWVFLQYAGQRIRMPVAVVLAAALLGFPLLGVLILEFRPDMLAALATAACAMVITTDVGWRMGGRRSIAIAAVLGIAALLAKPTLAPVTVVVLGVAAVVRCGLMPGTERQPAIRAALWTAGATLLAVLPYYLVAGKQIYEYVFTNAFGSLASVWALKLSAGEAAAYYLWGPGGNLSIGRPWLLVGVLLAIVCAPLLWRRHKRTTSAALVVSLVAYLAVTVPAHKSPFIGMVVPALLLAGVAAVLILLWSRLRPMAGLVAALALLAFSAVTWRPVIQRLAGTIVPEIQARHFTRIHQEVVDAVASVPGLESKQVFFPVIASHLTPENLEFGLRRKNLRLPRIPNLYLLSDEAAVRAARDRSEILVLLPTGSPLVTPWPPTTAMLPKINGEVDASGLYTVLKEIDTGIYGAPVRVLVRKP